MADKPQMFFCGSNTDAYRIYFKAAMELALA